MELKEKLTGIFEQIADLLEFKSENLFKINAFRNAANILRTQTSDIDLMIKDGSIKNIKGIGKGIQSIIFDVYENGFSTDLVQLNKEIPSGILDVLQIRGLGPKKIKLLYDELKISSLDDLESLCKRDRIKTIKGFGERTQLLILKEIERINSTKYLMLLDVASNLAKTINNSLSEMKSVVQNIVTSEFRRSLEIIENLEFVVFVKSIKDFISECEKNDLFLNEAEQQNEILNSKLPSNIVHYYRIKNPDNKNVHIYVTENEEILPSLLYLTTGSEEFTKELNFTNIAKAKNEEEIFSELKTPYVIPEMRELQYFQLKKELRENSKLDRSYFKGFFHFHTIYSDGKNTLQEMTNDCKSKGFEYLVVCDHSKSAFYANGLNEERVLAQKMEIDKISIETNTRIFHGIESDILQDGKLDYSDEFLNNFDFVVASIHSRFQMEEDEMTKRIIRAVENPHTNILGHPTGRLLLNREGYKLNIKKVIDACSANNVAIEINSHPQRLDLDWRNIFYAREKGCIFSINPDAHSVDEIDLIEYGIRIARKGGIQPTEVLNCFSLDKFQKYLIERKK